MHPSTTSLVVHACAQRHSADLEPFQADPASCSELMKLLTIMSRAYVRKTAHLKATSLGDISSQARSPSPLSRRACSSAGWRARTTHEAQQNKLSTNLIVSTVFSMACGRAPSQLKLLNALRGSPLSFLLQDSNSLFLCTLEQQLSSAKATPVTNGRCHIRPP